MSIWLHGWNRARSLFWNLIAAGTGQGATLALTIGLANLLGPAQFGRFAVATSTILALSALAQFGLAFTATNFIARHLTADRARAERIAAFCISSAAMTGTIIGAVVAFGAPIIASRLYDNASLLPLFIVAGAGIPAATLVLVQNAVLIGVQAFRSLAANAIAYAIFLLLGVSMGLALGGPLGAAIGYAVATALRAVHGSHLLRRTFTDLPPWRRPSDWKALLHSLAPFALPSALAGLTLTPAVWLTNAWLVNARGLNELGLFSTAFMVKTLVVFIPVQVGTVFLPRYVAASEADPAHANRYLLQIMLAIGGFSIAVAGTIALCAPWLMLVFGTRFALGTDALRLLMGAVVAESVATIGSYRLAGDRRMWTSLLAYTVPKDLILMGAALILVPRHGAVGLASAHLVSWLYGMVVVFMLITRPPRTVPGGTP